MSAPELLTERQCKAARALLSWSQLALAKKAGVYERTVIDFESKKRSPVPSTRKAIAAALAEGGVELLDREGVALAS